MRQPQLQKIPRVLVVDDDHGHLTTLKTIIKSWGYAVTDAQDGLEAVERVKAAPIDLMLMDVRMSGMDGIQALKAVKSHNPFIPIIIMTAYSSVASAVEALKAGAYDYLIKPLDFEVLKLTLERAREHAGLKAENQRLKAQLHDAFDSGNIIGKSRAMREMMDMLTMLAPTEATVLITGESGTGKELVARCLHHNSARTVKPFVVVNCAAISETLLESELFGHEKGAFTGADKRREGRFMLADGGTLFLDEIGETSPAMQAKLLRVIQEREIQRVGGEQVLPVDVRILAATHRDLELEVREGRFREDLYYRLNVVALHIPGLRFRPDDVPLLAHHFLARFTDKNRKFIKGFSPAAMDMLTRHAWPGNVRELENAVERAVILTTGDHITEDQLPLSIARLFQSEDAGAARVCDGDTSLEQIEKQAILATLAAAGGNKSEAARRLGVTRKTLHNKLKQYGAG